MTACSERVYRGGFSGSPCARSGVLNIVKAADLWEQNLVNAPHELKEAVQKWRKLNQRLKKLRGA